MWVNFVDFFNPFGALLVKQLVRVIQGGLPFVVKQRALSVLSLSNLVLGFVTIRLQNVL